jgi:hypothetical protein
MERHGRHGRHRRHGRDAWKGERWEGRMGGTVEAWKGGTGRRRRGGTLANHFRIALTLLPVEIIGWAGRLWSAEKPTNSNPFLMQICW